MKALTIQQPYATLTMIGARPYDFRRHDLFPEQRNQRIVIHAGAHEVTRSAVKEILNRIEVRDWSIGLIADKAVPVLERFMKGEFEFPRMRALGTAMLGWPSKHPYLLPIPIPKGQVLDGYAWPFTLPRRWEFTVEIKGEAGLWSYPGDMMPSLTDPTRTTRAVARSRRRPHETDGETMRAQGVVSQQGRGDDGT